MHETPRSVSAHSRCPYPIPPPLAGEGIGNAVSFQWYKPPVPGPHTVNPCFTIGNARRRFFVAA